MRRDYLSGDNARGRVYHSIAAKSVAPGTLCGPLRLPASYCLNTSVINQPPNIGIPNKVNGIRASSI